MNHVIELDKIFQIYSTKLNALSLLVLYDSVFLNILERAHIKTLIVLARTIYA